MRDLCYCLEQKGMSPAATFMVLSTFSGITSIKDKLNNVRESQRARAVSYTHLDVYKRQEYYRY